MDCTTPHKYSQMLKPWIKYLKYNYLNLDTVVALGTFSKHSSISCSSCSIRDVAIWTCSSQHTQINKLQHDLYLFLKNLSTNSVLLVHRNQMQDKRKQKSSYTCLSQSVRNVTMVSVTVCVPSPHSKPVKRPCTPLCCQSLRPLFGSHA